MFVSQFEVDLQQCAKCVFSASPTSVSSLARLLYLLHHQFQTVRLLLKEMGEGAGVPVEPDSQTELLDETQSIPGVIMAGVPGAGGFDAVFVIYIGGESTRTAVEEFWMNRSNDESSSASSELSDGSVCAMTVSATEQGVSLVE
eukprot:TRINITY_DN2331_c0_g1_i1.p1 TRINITY_DN2331_c0_g1~~TRINITY_DN2331_c0_g1_i1.p1  ORF type:complete len:144 (-),score=42.00 TRINITY_DN2331_c0_g1_i1:156-587(-)